MCWRRRTASAAPGGGTAIPGARCDSESHAYAFYFSDELLQSWDWSERYPQQPEILRYLNHVADRLDLKRDITFGARVAAAEWDGAATLWRLRTEDGRRYAARYLVTAVGCLSSANVPDIPGLGDFAGEWFHTGTWPHEGVDVAGKRVGMIGTGSTGIQAAPVLARGRRASHGLPAHGELLDPGAQPAAGRRLQGLGEGACGRDPAGDASHARTAIPGRSANAPRMMSTTPSARRCTAPPGRRAGSRCAPPSATS